MQNEITYMPKMYTDEELDKALSLLPDYDENIIFKSNAERLIALQDIYSIFISDKMAKEIYIKLYLSLLRSVNKKRSDVAVKQFCENSKIIKKQTYESIIGGSDSFTVIGPSGIGKSSAVSRSVRLLSETKVITINNSLIIPCLQVQAPADSSVKGLLLEILRKTDEILETKYNENAIRSHSTVDMLIGTVSQVALNHIGVLIVDEIQNVVNSKNGKIVVGTLTQLINNSGVSIAMIGTPESTVFFENDYMLARRAVGLNYDVMEYGEKFKSFCSLLLQYCYVKEQIEDEEKIMLWLYNHSNGNKSVVVNLIHDAQEIAILNGTERLDIASLNAAYETRLSMLHSYIAPKKVLHSPPKTIKRDFKILNGEITEDDANVYDLSLEAKASGTDIASYLKESGIKILEVKI